MKYVPKYVISFLSLHVATAKVMLPGVHLKFARFPLFRLIRHYLKSLNLEGIRRIFNSRYSFYFKFHQRRSLWEPREMSWAEREIGKNVESEGEYSSSIALCQSSPSTIPLNHEKKKICNLKILWKYFVEIFFLIFCFFFLKKCNIFDNIFHFILFFALNYTHCTIL